MKDQESSSMSDPDDFSDDVDENCNEVLSPR